MPTLLVVARPIAAPEVMRVPGFAPGLVLPLMLGLVLCWGHPAGAGPRPSAVETAEAEAHEDASGGPDSAGARGSSAVDVPQEAQDAQDAQDALTLDEVAFENRIYFKDETLRSFVGHPVPGALDRALLDEDARRIALRFQERGYLRAKVHLRLERMAPRRVRAVFVLAPGERAELRRVKVLGNVAVDEAALKEGFFSRPPEPLGALTRAGLFHRPYLDQDAQRLVANYYRRGFLEARVVDTRVEADPDLDGLGVVLRVVEGPLYELGAITFIGDVPPGLTDEQLRAAIPVKPGDVADVVTIQQSADALLEPLRLEGHPFARLEQGIQVVEPPSGNAAHRAVALALRFVRGPKPVVGAVRVVGNVGTAERVIRRDIAVRAGATYDHAAMKATERALLATGFFQAAQARAVPTSDPQTADVEVAVTEQQTWLFSIAPAVDTTAGGEGLIGVGMLADRNFLGTGMFVSTFARLSARRQTFDLSVTEPRLLDTRNAVTAELHRREISFRGFRTRSELGGGARALIPLGGGLVVGGGLTAEYGGVVLYDVAGDEALPSEAAPRLRLDDAATPGGGLLPAGVLRNPLSLSFAWDRRDNVLLPRNGVYASVSASYAGPLTLSGLAFLDVGATLRLFWTPLWGITLKSNTDVGRVINPHGGEVPVTDRYFLGGLGSVRGFPVLSIAPSRPLATDDGGAVTLPAGGTTRVVQNVELEFPLWPGTPFRGFTFLDAGNAFDGDELATVLAGGALDRGASLIGGLFWSTGFGLLIETPVLPFRLEWSAPLTRRSADQALSFFLGVGSAF